MKLVIFDCDGTLVDSQHVIWHAMQEAFAVNDLACPDRNSVMSIVGLSLPVVFDRLAPGVSFAGKALLAEAYKSAFSTLRLDPDRTEPLFPGALDVVNTLAAREDIVLGIATGKSRRGVAHLLDIYGLQAHFLTIQTADTHPSKPHPSMIMQAMADAGIEPDATVMIGDTTYDIVMGLNAGVHTIGVDWGYHPVDHLRHAGAHDIIGSFDHVLAAIDRPRAEAEG